MNFMDSNNAVKITGESTKNRKVMIDRSTSSGFIKLNKSNVEISDQVKSESKDSKHENLKSKFIPLSINDRDMPDFLEANYEESDIMSNKKFIICSSTQTENTDEIHPTNILRTSEFNHPAIIINSSATRRLNTPNTDNNYTSHELLLTKSQLYNVNRKYHKLKKCFHKLYSEYQKVRDIASVFTESIEKSVHGEPVDLRVTLQSCRQIYPDAFDYNFSSEHIQSEQDDDYFNSSNTKSMLSTVPLLSKYLNYNKIKLHLINANIKLKLLVLQALRWKITLSQPVERNETIMEYIKNDLLDLHKNQDGSNDNSGKSSILPYLLIPLDVVEPHPLQQSAARLLNTFASFKSGRNYLANGPIILNVIVQCLDSKNAESIDAFTCDMIIATLQKLSLRRNQRLYMIAAGLVEWLIHHLKAECHTMGTYRLEYATALLMNLSLQKEAQVRAAAMPTILISTLIILLSLEHLPALPYVNGSLNNFIANSAINKEAKIIGLGSILEYHRRYRTGELRKHLDHILLRHRRPNNEIIEEVIHDDDDREEYDNLDDELDEMDPVKVNPGDLFGETLLATCYSLPPDMFPGDKSHDVKITDESINDINLQNGESYCKSPRLTPINYKLMINPIKLVEIKENSKSNEELIDSKKLKVNCSVSTLNVYDNNLLSEETILTDLNLSSLSETIDNCDEFTTSKSCNLISTSSLNVFDDEKVNLPFDTSNMNSSITNFEESTLSSYKKEITDETLTAIQDPEIIDDELSTITSFVSEPQEIFNEVTNEKEEEDEAFISKPKIFRTPPQSASSLSVKSDSNNIKK
ncbi:lisH domain-containing protein ARMC9-like isoform X2 [Microplitis mediator]|uniref:lisH domain-containing protein ARMC9-like isoform X2 n=1 Tax=Microplitis mediator TaxID=375433 RepID=UPI0025522BDB|nr:lisH domain-containing protein ARMC9-like isoform X2 [Microplitis mediator]